MNKENCLFAVVKEFSELDLSEETFNSIKMGYIFENLIGRFYQNVDAGQYYTGRDIIKMMVYVITAEGCDDIYDEGKVITIADQAAGTSGIGHIILGVGIVWMFVKLYNLKTAK